MRLLKRSGDAFVHGKSNAAGEVRLLLLDQRVEALAQHLLLLVRRRLREGVGVEAAVASAAEVRALRAEVQALRQDVQALMAMAQATPQSPQSAISA